MALGSGERHYDHSPTYTRYIQWDSRWRVQAGERRIRLDAISRGVLESQSGPGIIGGGPLCLQVDPPTASFFQLDTRSSSGSSGCIPAGLEQVKGFANPPWCLIGHVLNKIRSQEAQVVLVAPVWKSQAWCPVVLKMLVDYPRLIPPQEGLLQRGEEQRVTEIIPQLAIWPVSGKDIETIAFLQKLQSSCWPPGGQSPPSPMSPCLENEPTGMLKGVVIPFQVL